MSDLSTETIQEALRHVEHGPFGAQFHYFEQVGSTNDILRQMAEHGADEGTLVLADEQISGRGRMGRAWVAPPGTSLLMSILFRPQLQPAEAHRLVMVAGLAVIHACERVIGLHIDVKWPNDLQFGGKKLAGILPESAIEGEQLSWVIIGVGVNVNTRFEIDDPLGDHATSLAIEVGHKVERGVLLAEIMAQLHVWNGYLHHESLSTAWRDRCVTLGQRVVISTPREKLTGIAEDLDQNGALLLLTDDKERHHLMIGEATLAP